MSILCRAGHFMQSLAKNNFVNRPLEPIYTTEGCGVGKHYFSVQILIFHAIPSKEIYCKLTKAP